MEPNQSELEPFSIQFNFHTYTNSLTLIRKIKVLKSLEVIEVLVWNLILAEFKNQGQLVSKKFRAYLEIEPKVSPFWRKDQFINDENHNQCQKGSAEIHTHEIS